MMLEKKYAVSAKGIIYKTNDLAQIFYGLSHLVFWAGIAMLLVNEDIAFVMMVGAMAVGLPAMAISSLLTNEGK